MIIYTDGAYASSKDCGGWAFVMVQEDVEICNSFGTALKTTNNRMEIMAAIKALERCEADNISSCTLFTDSMYVIGTMTKQWKRKKNLDLWPKLDALVKSIDVEWLHVKGHSGDKWNTKCDLLAVHASNIEIN